MPEHQQKTMTNKTPGTDAAGEVPASVERPLVAYLGPAGTYTHTAALQWFPSGAGFVSLSDIPAIFNAVDQGVASHGVVPVENSIEGSVTATLDCFVNSSLKINAELLLPIRHCLLAAKGTVLNGLHKIVAHQQSLGQCRQWLLDNCPLVEQTPVSSNAEAALQASAQQGVAAIAGMTAAALYELEVLAEGIADAEDNTTRFLLLERESRTHPSGRDKTSLIILTSNEPGSLFKALEPFQRHGVNLNKLESRPSRKMAWSYSFYLDLEGHADDQVVSRVLQEIQAQSVQLKWLGSYPAAGVI